MKIQVFMYFPILEGHFRSLWEVVGVELLHLLLETCFIKSITFLPHCYFEDLHICLMGQITAGIDLHLENGM